MTTYLGDVANGRDFTSTHTKAGESQRDSSCCAEAVHGRVGLADTGKLSSVCLSLSLSLSLSPNLLEGEHVEDEMSEETDEAVVVGEKRAM